MEEQKELDRLREYYNQQFETRHDVRDWLKTVPEDYYETAAKIRDHIPQLRAMGTKGAMIADLVIRAYLTNCEK